MTLRDTGSYCFSLMALGLVACFEGPPDPVSLPVPVEVGNQGLVQIPADPDSGVNWRQWSATVFDTARRSQRPVLLYAARIGCDGLFAGDDPLARWQAETRYIPVRIDPDRHPAVARRYAPAGCPSLSILLEDGQEIIRATDMRRQNVPLLLSRMHEHLQKRRDVVEKEVEPSPARHGSQTYRLSVAAARTSVVAAYDTLYGGFGGPYKFPETQVLAFLQELGTGEIEDGARKMLTRTLDGLLAGPLWTTDVLVMSHTPDWQTPRYEAHAADQAGLLTVLGKAAAGSANYHHAGQRLFDTISGHWFDAGTGAFRSRRLAGKVDEPGWQDPVIQADANALLILACLRSGESLDREDAAQRLASMAGETLLRELVTTEGVVRHALIDDTPAGLLRDQMLVALAFDELERQTGRGEFGEAATRVMSWADEHLWDEATGVFADAPVQSWPETWTSTPDEHDDRAPSGVAVAAEALAAVGDPVRALRVLHGIRLTSPTGRRQAAAARQLLVLEGSR